MPVKSGLCAAPLPAAAEIHPQPAGERPLRQWKRLMANKMLIDATHPEETRVVSNT